MARGASLSPFTQLRRGVRPYLPIYSLPSCLTPSLASQAIEALRIEFLEANPQYDAGRLLVVANTARTIDRDLTRAQTLTLALALTLFTHIPGAHGHQA